MNLHPNNAKTKIVNGAVVCEPRRKYVAIVGFGPTSMDVRSIQNDPDWEIWGLNNGYMNPCMWDGPLVTGPIIENAEGRHRVFDVEQQTANLRVDRWWEMHPMRVQPSYDVEWLGNCPVPVYLLHDLNQGDSAILRRWPKSPSYAPESLPAMPNAVTYPLAAMEAAIQMPKAFWASTFAYQIVFATLAGFEGIGLFGLDFGSEREVLFERPNALWWAGYAAGRGVKIMVPGRSSFLVHGARYGYEYDEEVAWCNSGVDYWNRAWRLISESELQAAGILGDDLTTTEKVTLT